MIMQDAFRLDALPRYAELRDVRPLADLTDALVLSSDDQRQIVDQAIQLITDVYTHLPLKRAMYAVDPERALRLLRYRVTAPTPTEPPSAPPLSQRQFHWEL